MVLASLHRALPQDLGDEPAQVLRGYLDLSTMLSHQTPCEGSDRPGAEFSLADTRTADASPVGLPAEVRISSVSVRPLNELPPSQRPETAAATTPISRLLRSHGVIALLTISLRTPS